MQALISHYIIDRGRRNITQILHIHLGHCIYISMYYVFSFLHSQLCTCTLRNDYEGQAMLLNLLLRNFLHYNLYTQAVKLVSKSTYPENASNNHWARYLYYLGKEGEISL